jgi:hypothetical protein
MAHWKKSFPSKFLQAADLDAPFIATVKQIVNENVGQGDAVELKPVAVFEEQVKGVVLNLTRAEALAEIAGSEDMDDWPGTRILLRRGTTRYQGKKVACIEIARPPRTKTAVPASPPPPSTPIELGDAFEEPGNKDSDVPF